MQTSIFSLHYFPCIAYFCAWAQSEVVWIDAGEHYEKQSYRNRTQILTSESTLALSVPIKKQLPKQSVNTIEIDYSQNWGTLHLRSLQTNYGKAPYFPYYFDEIEAIYNIKPVLLADLNKNMLTLCRKILELPQEPAFCENYIQIAENKDFIDYRQAIHPKKNIPNTLQNSLHPYTQVFGMGFVPNMSILDLIFCEGTNAKNIIRA